MTTKKTKTQRNREEYRRRTATVAGILANRLCQNGEHRRLPRSMARVLGEALAERHPEVTLDNVRAYDVDHRVPVSTYLFEAGGSFEGTEDPLFIECHSLENLHLIPRDANRMRWDYLCQAEKDGLVDLGSVDSVREFLGEFDQPTDWFESIQ